MIDLLWTIRIALRALESQQDALRPYHARYYHRVGAVIAMLAVGTGAREQVAAQIASMGSNLLIVLPGSSASGGVRMGMGTQPTLKLEDAESDRQDCPAVEAVAPIQTEMPRSYSVIRTGSTGVQGTTPSMLEIREWPLAAGRCFTDDDVKSAAKVAVLGQTVVDNLFGGIDPVGQIVRIKKIPFRVIGILEPKASPPRARIRMIRFTYP